MVISDFTSKTIFLDTAPLIYFIEGHSAYQGVLSRIFSANDKGTFTFLTSTITLLEVLVKPLREGKHKIVHQYRNILTAAAGIELMDIDNKVAEKAAVLRAAHSLKTPDALQLVVAAVHEADYFLTNDVRLKNIASISVITLDDINAGSYSDTTPSRTASLPPQQCF